MGWFDDLTDTAGDAAKGLGKATKKVGGSLVDVPAWKRTGAAIADGPGGKEIRKADLANIALDSTMLIPGAGMAGGAARVAARQALKKGGKETAEKLAKKATVDSLRSPANRAVRSKADDTLTKLLPKKGAAGARKAAKDPLDSQLGRMAAKQKAGVGTKVGFGQTKKRVLRTAAATVGANAAARAYDTGLGGMFDGGSGKGKGSGAGEGGAGGEGAPGTMYMMGANGEQTALPAEFQKALAAFMAQGGSPDGAQVVYLGN